MLKRRQPTITSTRTSARAVRGVRGVRARAGRSVLALHAVRVIAAIVACLACAIGSVGAVRILPSGAHDARLSPSVVATTSTTPQVVSLRHGAAIDVSDARSDRAGDGTSHASHGVWALLLASSGAVAPAGSLLLPFDDRADTPRAHGPAEHERARAPPLG